MTGLPHAAPDGDTARFDDDNKVQIADDVTAPPAAPSALGDGTSISTLTGPGFTPRYWFVDIEKASGAGAVTLTGPVTLWALRRGATTWRKIAQLNNGSDIALDDDQGSSEVMQFLGGYERYEIVSAGVVGGGYDAHIGAIETRQE